MQNEAIRGDLIYRKVCRCSMRISSLTTMFLQVGGAALVIMCIERYMG